MRILKLFALPILLFTGLSHAAVYNFDVSWTTSVAGCPLCSGTGAGEGTWDTTNNAIDFAGIENIHIDFNDGNTVSNAAVTRHFTIDTDALTYTYVNTACDDGGTDTLCSDDCSSCYSGATKPLGDKIYLLNPTELQQSGFIWDGVRPIRTLLTNVQSRTFTFANLTAVPVPSATLLFGSAMMGLMGLSRNYRKRS